VTLTEDVGRARAEDPRHYLVMINGTTHLLQAGALTYDPATRTVTFRRLPIHPGNSVAITLLGLWDHLPHIPSQSVTCRTRVPESARPRWVGLVLIGAAILGLLVSLLLII
jgi:hypothetical protein